MAHHLEHGHAVTGLYTVHRAATACRELGLVEQPDSDYVLGLWNENGDGLTLEGSADELRDYLQACLAHVTRATGL